MTSDCYRFRTRVWLQDYVFCCTLRRLAGVVWVPCALLEGSPTVVMGGGVHTALSSPRSVKSQLKFCCEDPQSERKWSWRCNIGDILSLAVIEWKSHSSYWWDGFWNYCFQTSGMNVEPGLFSFHASWPNSICWWSSCDIFQSSRAATNRAGGETDFSNLNKTFVNTLCCSWRGGRVGLTWSYGTTAVKYVAQSTQRSQVNWCERQRVTDNFANSYI